MSELTYLIEIGQRVGILAERLVLSPQTIAGRDAPEALEIDNVQRRYVVAPPLQVVAPVALLPEAEAVHLRTALTERSVAVRRAAQVQVLQLLHVGAHHLSQT